MTDTLVAYDPATLNRMTDDQLTYAWTLDDVLAATGGELLGEAKTQTFLGISTDSRTLRPGELFVALVGENFNGHSLLDRRQAVVQPVWLWPSVRQKY